MLNSIINWSYFYSPLSDICKPLHSTSIVTQASQLPNRLIPALSFCPSSHYPHSRCSFNDKVIQVFFDFSFCVLKTDQNLFELKHLALGLKNTVCWFCPTARISLQAAFHRHRNVFKTVFYIMKCFCLTESIQNRHNRVASIHAHMHHLDSEIFLVVDFDFVVIFLIFKV